jgi:hypothetical protein
VSLVVVNDPVPALTTAETVTTSQVTA